jgi:hypothetical protein
VDIDRFLCYTIKKDNIVKLEYLQKTVATFLVTVGMGLAFSACAPDILRNGSYMLVSVTGTFGLFAGSVGLILLTSTGDSFVRRYVLNCTLLECIALLVPFIGVSLVNSRDTFFAPSGQGVVRTSTLQCLMATIVAIFVATVFARLLLMKAKSVFGIEFSPTKRLSKYTLILCGCGLLCLLWLNLVPRHRVIEMGQMQVTLITRGFLWPITFDSFIEGSQLENQSKTNQVVIRDELLVQWSGQVIKIKYPFTADRALPPNLNFVNFADGTSVVFDRARIEVKQPFVTIEANTENGTVVFPKQKPKEINASAVIRDSFLAVMLLVYLAFCSERFLRFRGISRDKIAVL